MVEKQYDVQFDGYQYFCVVNVEDERVLARLDTRLDALAWLEMYKMLLKDNKQLKLELEDCKCILRNTEECQRKISELVEIIAEQISENTDLQMDINQLQIENRRLKELGKYD